MIPGALEETPAAVPEGIHGGQCINPQILAY
jgi:hypothetical protein